MRFLITRTSDYGGKNPPCEGAIMLYKDEKSAECEWEIEINSLEELLQLSVKTVQPLILFAQDYDKGNVPELEIYDYYRE